MQYLDGSSASSAQLFQCFYEALLLLSVLDPSTLAGPTQSHEAQESDENSQITKFLDRLSWMCDFTIGGLSVCAIAMQSTMTETVFWFAIEHKYVQRTRIKLNDILEKLKTAATLSEGEADKLKRELCADHIAYAADKVRNYARKLSRLKEKISEDEAQSEVQLLRDLQRLVDVAGNLTELCSAADHFRDSESLVRITRLVKERGMSDVWSSLRHCIGRLGSWHHASHSLVEYARTQPELFKAFKVEAVETPKPTRVAISNNSVNVLSALRRMCPLEEVSELSRAVNALDRLRKSDIANEFKEAYGNKNFKPRVHAEVCLLEHFYCRSLPFVNGYRYIGCSKPSCYCCDLYFRFHPGQFVRRRSHGNVWTNWTSVYATTVESGEPILGAMTKVIRQHVNAQLHGQLSKQPRMPDSTTGLSNSHRGRE